MPHGRSFKIFKQREFSEIILPRYFVMTKKSSFLRQLNLYGFNRFSAGRDQGSYYHEKFLRGMKFLTRRMTRQKVNGNRIRSAGNPDEEPSLFAYPSCPVEGMGDAKTASNLSKLTMETQTAIGNMMGGGGASSPMEDQHRQPTEDSGNENEGGDASAGAAAGSNGAMKVC